MAVWVVSLEMLPIYRCLKHTIGIFSLKITVDISLWVFYL